MSLVISSPLVRAGLIAGGHVLGLHNVIGLQKQVGVLRLNAEPAGQADDLEGRDPPRRRKMRPPAKVDIFSLLIQTDLIVRQFGKDACLQCRSPIG